MVELHTFTAGGEGSILCLLRTKTPQALRHGQKKKRYEIQMLASVSKVVLDYDPFWPTASCMGLLWDHSGSRAAETEPRSAPLSSTIYRNLLKFMSIESVTLSSPLALCLPRLLLPSVFPRIRVFSNESTFASGAQSTGISAAASILPVNIQG